MCDLPKGLGNKVITGDTPVREAMIKLGEDTVRTVVVIDEGNKLIGIVSDADFRRGFLAGKGLEDPVSEVMNPHPITLNVNLPAEDFETRMRMIHREVVPIVDDDGRLCDLRSLFSTVGLTERLNEVVIMAGGRGSRLMPYTEDCPKPMLRVGNKPLLETTIESLKQMGFNQFNISINYLGNIIKDYFGDGSAFGVRIRYLEEQEPLDTAGALSLLSPAPVHPIIVMNGDVLTRLNMAHLVDSHVSRNSFSTMCIQEHKIQIPYGVVESDGLNFVGLQEKPYHSFSVNAGLYIFNPGVLEYITVGEALSMPDLFNKVAAANEKVHVYPIRDYWLDIGQLEDFERAHQDYSFYFDKH